MRVSILVVVGLPVLSSVLAACTAAGPRPAAGQSRLEEGRRLFSARCSTCHDLPAPAACTQGVMDAMAPEAGLRPEERAAIEAYLAAAR